jgi:hypothetical protein
MSTFAIQRGLRSCCAVSDTTWSSSDCYGHSESDSLYGLYFTSDSKTLSNDELLDLTDPTTLQTEMGYLYDDFEWDHCEDSGISASLTPSAVSGSSGAVSSTKHD